MDDMEGAVKLAFNSFLALDRRINWQLLVGCNIFPFRRADEEERNARLGSNDGQQTLESVTKLIRRTLI